MGFRRLTGYSDMSVLGMAMNSRFISGAPAHLLYDTFTDTNGTGLASHTMDIGSGWTVDAGTITINSNKARTGSAPGTATADAGASDIIGSVVINATSDLGGAGFAIRHSNTSNYWIPWVDYNGSTIDLYEVNGGSASIRATRSFNPAASTDYTIRVQCYGQIIVATIDGANYLVYPVAALNETNTRFGIRGFRTTAENHDFDEFTVDSSPTPLLVDTFTDTNSTAIASHTPDSNPNGGSWLAHSGTWDIQSNTLNCATAATAPNGDAVSIPISSADFIMVATVPTNDNRGVCFRVTNNDNLWFARLTGVSIQLYRRESGSYTLEASGSGTSAAPYTFAVVCQGDTISVHYGTTIITKTSATLNQTAARVGYLAVANSNTFDTLRVLPL